jgi:hypothetical protein
MFTTSSCSSCTMRIALVLVALATGSLKPSLLVSLSPRRPPWPRPFALFFTCTNAIQAATNTYNTRPRVSPHNVVNHSSPRNDLPLILGRSWPSTSSLWVNMMMQHSLGLQTSPIPSIGGSYDTITFAWSTSTLLIGRLQP